MIGFIQPSGYTVSSGGYPRMKNHRFSRKIATMTAMSIPKENNISFGALAEPENAEPEKCGRVKAKPVDKKSRNQKIQKSVNMLCPSLSVIVRHIQPQKTVKQ